MMDNFKKVIWTEGAFLTQQHFQHNDRAVHHEHRLDRNLNNRWGVEQCVLDRTALKEGCYRIRKLILLLPDFRWIEYDSDVDEYALSLLLVSDLEQIFLVCPRGYKVSQVNGYPDTRLSQCAFVSTSTMIKDDLDASRESTILLGRPNLILTNSLEKHADDTAIKLNEVKKIKLKEYHVSDDFTPPILTMNNFQHGLKYVNEVLHNIDSTIHSLLIEKENKLNIENNKLHLHTVLLKYKAMLMHCLYDKTQDPKQVFLLFLQLLAELSVFSFNRKSDEFIPYDHFDIHTVFSNLIEKISLTLRQSVTSNEIYIPFVQRSEGLYIVDNIPVQVEKMKNIYLIIKNASDVMEGVPGYEREIKCSAISDINMILECAMPGLTLKNVKQTSELIEDNLNEVIYEVEQSGKYWKKVKEENTFAVQMSRSTLSTKLILLIVKS